jgi:carbon storage regulator CsrA
MSTHHSNPASETQGHQRFERIVEQAAGDTVVIGDVEIVLLRIRNDRAHIGVNAPDGVPVARSEVYRERSRDYLT